MWLDNSGDLSDPTVTKEKVKISRRISQDLDGCRNAHKNRRWGGYAN